MTRPLLALITATLFVAAATFAPAQPTLNTKFATDTPPSTGGTFVVEVYADDVPTTTVGVNFATQPASTPFIDIETAIPHGFQPNDRIFLQLDPSFAGFDGINSVYQVPGANQLRLVRSDDTATSTGVQTVTNEGNSEITLYNQPVLASFRISWNPNDAIEFVSATGGDLGQLTVSPVLTDSVVTTTSFVNIATDSNIANTNFSPLVAEITFNVVDDTAFAGLDYDITVSKLTSPGTISLGKLIENNNALLDGSNVVITKTPDFVSYDEVLVDSSETEGNTLPANLNVHDWMQIHD